MLSNLSLRSKLSIYVGAAITPSVSLRILLFGLHATPVIGKKLDGVTGVRTRGSHQGGHPPE